MARLSKTERLEVGRLRLGRLWRRGVGRARRSPLLRWQQGPPVADRFHIAPPDIRATDASFTLELAAGLLGLAGTVVDLQGRSAFAVAPPNEAWARELHGFAWLRDVQVNNSPVDLTAETMVRSMVQDWIARHPASAGGIAWDIDVLARRILSWLVSSGLLLDGATPAEAAEITRSLGEQIVHLGASWREVRDGEPRLLALVALTQAGLCLEGHAALRKRAEAALRRELTRQIRPDGGHVSRNSATLVELLLDFLPLKQSFLALGRGVPQELERAIAAMLGMVRLMCSGDGTLARFHGVGRTRSEDLATVLAYDDGKADVDGYAEATGYVRLERGGTVIVADVAGPPPLGLARQAHASALAFEMCVRRYPLLVNCGAPGPADGDWLAVARSTASHSTLTVEGASSSSLIRHAAVESLLHGVPITGPQTVELLALRRGEAEHLSARHDGYVARFGVWHSRDLTLEQSGERLVGIDRLVPAGGGSPSLGAAIHFHLHPDSTCERAGDERAAVITLPDGERWRLTALAGAELAVEETTYLADAMGPRPSLQIVLRGRASGPWEARWLVEREATAVAPAAPAASAAEGVAPVEAAAETEPGKATE